jgi:predicted nucleic acid-binding protein
VIFVLDASAMIAYLRDEPGADRVSEALLDPDGQCIAHVLNWCEVFYDFHRASGPKHALDAVKDLAQVGVAENAEIGTEFWQAVGALKAIHRRVSLADCFAVALARQLGATVLTADHHEFDALADQGVCAVGFIR